MTAEITIEQVKELYPQLGNVGLNLTTDYMNLALRVVELKLIEEKELLELEKKYVDLDNMFEKLLNISADILTLLKGMVNEIQIPKDPIEFEKWEKQSTDYLKVVCHDAFIDVFISTNEAINKGFK
jgi:hypothetical protein